VSRTFTDKPAVRERTPLLIGLTSPSGAGKTMSGLELATGIQRVDPGEIFVVDSEARRSLHYADKYKFRHVAFGAPFGPPDYKAVIGYCIERGAKTIMVDSTSHEHEGPGGVLEWHEKELDRMAGQDFGKRNRMTMAAWTKPKAARRDLINFILQAPVNFIFCFRAKAKIKLKKGQDPIEMGYQAISGDEWIFEMQLNCLLLPGAKGVPTWESDMPGEKACIKLPEQFRSLFASGPRLSADVGEALATWAAGNEAPKPKTAAELLEDYANCSDPATLGRIESQRALAWTKLTKDEKAQLKTASADTKARIEQAERTFADNETDGGNADDNDASDEGEAA